ncbi:MAG: nucleotidyltransferase family protein [Bacteroidales bacterium]|nr:nucleotidyltransferase family protein [Bacteroidales bacterium]
MEGFVLAAGLGTRLRPLTDTCPKALIDMGGQPLLHRIIARLHSAGALRVVVNAYHLADQVIDYVNHTPWPCPVVISDERPTLMDTGGGLKFATPLFTPNETVLVHNVDIVSDIDLKALVSYHLQSGNAATLCVDQRDTSRHLLTDEAARLVGWHNSQTGEELWADTPQPTAKEVAFSGISVISPSFINAMPAADHPYPIVPCFLQAAKEMPVGTFIHTASHWFDTGKPSTLNQARQWIASCNK